MALERKWLPVAPTALTSNGTQFGVVTVADTAGFKVKGRAVLTANPNLILAVQIQRVNSSTQMVVGPIDSTPSPANFTNVTAYTVASGAMIYFPGNQDKNGIKPDDIEKAVYESDPTVALRTIPVDQYGNFITDENPFPVTFDGTISVGEVEIKGSPSGDLLNVNADGSINVNVVETPVTGQVVKSIYNQVLNVVSGSTTQLVTYTVPVGATAALERINVSGENIARYDVLYNSALFDTKRTNFGCDLDADFDYTTGTNNAFTMNAGDIIIVQVLHDRPYSGNFNARIQVLEID